MRQILGGSTMKKFMSFAIILIIITAIIAPRVLSIMNKETNEEEPVTEVAVSGQQVQKGNLNNYVELIGATRAKDAVNIMPAVPAKVEKVYVVVGNFVEKGELLFTLEETSVRDQVNQAEIAVSMAQVGVKNAQAGINQAQIGYELSQSNYSMQQDSYAFGASNLEKYETLYAEGIISESELEQARLQSQPETLSVLEKQLEQSKSTINQAQIGVESANASLRQAQESLRQAREMLKDMTMTAPISGFVTMSNVSDNNYASNTQPAIVIQDISEIIVDASVTESLINQLSIGAVVEVKLDALSNQTFKGTIDTISTSADQRTLLYPLTVKLDNADHKIKPGMFATVIILTEEKTDTLYVPSEAVLLRDGLYYVYVEREGGTVLRLEVKVGIDTGHYTEILEGVVFEDVVITKGIGLIDDNSRINVIRSDQ
ncbi:MAG: hypothetical protein CVU95_14440 [Firmicutes bacterium HGW-Firmicutes-2]|jgi:RND family efflux transporter MFP subunit|nr:MAG: hypothetical protein CVU95_14440 [Firmicutes bacterium HGW-Firmicutes-2]